MKKTLLLTHEYFPFRGGIANYCYGLFSHLPQQNYIVAHDMKSGAGDSSLGARDGQIGTSDSLLATRSPASSRVPSNEHRVPLLGKLFRPRWLTGYRNVKKLCQQQKIELIFTPHILPLGLIAEKVGKKLNLPYVLSLHGLDINLALAKDRTTAIRLLTNAHHVIVNSETTRSIVAPLLPANKLTVITPYMTGRLVADPVRVAAIKQQFVGQQIILTVSRLVKRKNHELMLKAMNALGRDDSHYLIVGNGPELASLQHLATELKINDQVSFLTDVSDEDIANYYQAADIFMLPTLNLGADIEGYGIVYLDAAHFHLPIIAGQHTSAEEILQHEVSGLLVDSTSLEAISANLKYLLDHPEVRQQLGEAAYNQLQTLPDWTTKANQLNAILS